MKFKIDLKVLFFLALFYFTDQIQIYLLIMIFGLIHELAHLLIGKFLRFEIKQISLMPLGFFVDLKPNIVDYNKKILKSNIIELKKIFIAIAGPVMNLILIMIFLFLKIETNFKIISIYSNFLIFIFNLLPIYPLDGERILSSLFKVFWGNEKAIFITNTVSNITIIILTVLSSLLILYLKNITILLILIYLWTLVQEENRRFNIYVKSKKIV